LAVLILISACTPYHDEVQSSPSTDEETLPLSEGAKVLNTYCISCHNGGIGSEWGDLQTESDWRAFARKDNNRVVPGNPMGSLLILRMKHGPGDETMPSAPPYPTVEEYRKVYEWISVLTQEDQETSEPEVPAGNGDLIARASSEKIKLGDRRLVSSIFTSIFGPDIKPVSDDLILKRVTKFGGPCDSLNSYAHEYPTVVRCNEVGQGGAKVLVDTDANNAESSMIPESSATREGFRLKACKKAVFGGKNTVGTPHDAPLVHAIKLAKNTNDLTSLSADPVPTGTEIRRAYKLFYPGQSPPSRVVSGLQQVAVRAQNAGLLVVGGETDLRYESWRYVLFTLCQASDWQIE